MLIYNSVSGTGLQANPGKYGNRCPGEPFGREDIVEVPLDDPEDAEVIGAFDLGENPAGEMMHGCHDMGVILGRVDRAACAGHPMGIPVFDITDLDDPEFLYSVEVDEPGIGNTVHGWHSAAFTWDGRQIIGGWEPGGGTQPRCQVTGAPLTDDPEEAPYQTDVMKTLFMFDTSSRDIVGRHTLPRPQSQWENCTMHNYNIVPDTRRRLLVHGSYQAGTALMDFTDGDDTYEIAWMDPLPLDPPVNGVGGGRTNFRGGDWASYWYNGYIYESDARRGLYIWKVEARELRGRQVKLDYLNPQTQHVSIDRTGACSTTAIAIATATATATEPRQGGRRHGGRPGGVHRTAAFWRLPARNSAASPAMSAAMPTTSATMERVSLPSSCSSPPAVCAGAGSGVASSAAPSSGGASRTVTVGAGESASSGPIQRLTSFGFV